MVYLDLILNLSLLVALTVFSGFIDKRWPRRTRTGILLQGFLFGSAAIIAMLRPLVLGPGLIFDGRSVMLSLCALFFGPWAAALSFVMSAAGRIALGGMGALTGVLVSLSSVSIGLLVYFRFKNHEQLPSTSHLYLFGVAVHLAMLAMMFTLPGGVGWSVISRIGLPVIILYPLATILAGRILADQFCTIQTKNALHAERQRLAYIIEGTNAGTWEWNVQTGETIFNERWANIIGYTLAELSPVSIETWIRFAHPDDLRQCNEQLARHFAGRLDFYSAELRVRHKDGRWVWVLDRGKVSAWTKDGQPLWMRGTHVDITERKEKELELKRIEWLLTPRPDLPHDKQPDYLPPYGDLVALNTCRFIFDAVGAPVLKDIVLDYLELLDTSAAIYEKNGDYAVGIFSSGWCRFMDAASFANCGERDIRKALSCGRWHCHESCWTKTSQVAMKTGQPADVECSGGIRLYAAPILVKGAVVGAINFGYGDPPQDEEKLRALADQYGVDSGKLSALAVAYESRPPYIINLAKRRLEASARLIGLIIERKQAEEQIRITNEELEQKISKRTLELEQTIAQLEEMNQIFVGRELKMIELKEQIAKLEKNVALES